MGMDSNVFKGGGAAASERPAIPPPNSALPDDWVDPAHKRISLTKIMKLALRDTARPSAKASPLLWWVTLNLLYFFKRVLVA